MSEEAIINPRQEKGEPALPTTGLLCVNPAEMNYLCRRVEKMGARRHFFFNGKLYIVPGGQADPPTFLAGPAVGAPMAVLALEKLIALGAKRIIVYGWCGSLSPDLRVGDLLLPTWGFSEEGTSSHYPIREKGASSAAWRDKLEHILAAGGFTCKKGSIWTTDAPYRETRDKVSRYAAKSILGVDMEFSALATVAIYRRIELAAVYPISDELWRDKWQPAYREKSFHRENRRLLDYLLENLIDEGR